MANEQNGCAEFVGKAGSYYSPFLAEQADNGVVCVPAMVDNADEAGLLTTDTNNLQKGDILVYGDDDHVVIYDGEGGYYGNSSSCNVTVHSNDYTDIGMLVTKIIYHGFILKAKDLWIDEYWLQGHTRTHSGHIVSETQPRASGSGYAEFQSHTYDIHNDYTDVETLTDT